MKKGEIYEAIVEKVEFPNKDMYDATVDADTLMLVTEWKEFRMPSWNVLKKAMRGYVVVDGRNIYNGKELKENGFNYYKIG